MSPPPAQPQPKLSPERLEGGGGTLDLDTNNSGLSLWRMSEYLL